MSRKVKTKASKPLSINSEERTIQVVMTTNEVDRDMDIVETRGIGTAAFEENPVVLWAHNSSEPPIGNVTELEKMDNMLLGTVKFADTPRAKEIFSLYEQGMNKDEDALNFSDSENNVGLSIRQLENTRKQQREVERLRQARTSFETSRTP